MIFKQHTHYIKKHFSLWGFFFPELNQLPCSRNVLTLHKHSDSTWKPMSQCARRKKGSRISLRRYVAGWYLRHPRLSILCGLKLSWMMYWSILVPCELGRILEGFINKPDCQRCGGCWLKSSLCSFQRSYEKKRHQIPMSNAIHVT